MAWFLLPTKFRFEDLKESFMGKFLFFAFCVFITDRLYADITYLGSNRTAVLSYAGGRTIVEVELKTGDRVNPHIASELANQRQVGKGELQFPTSCAQRMQSTGLISAWSPILSSQNQRVESEAEKASRIQRMAEQRRQEDEADRMYAQRDRERIRDAEESFMRRKYEGTFPGEVR
jgi:hypothetical protein